MVLGWILTLASIILLYRQGLIRSFFHQDDIPALAVVADWRGWLTVFHLNNEHLNITFWILQRILWLAFGVNFAPYLITNILLHISVLCLIFLIAYKQTRSFIWASLPVWGMVINPNWFCVVWWVNGQMVMLATLFALVAYLVILEIKNKPNKKFLYPLLYLFSVLPGFSWGVGLTWPTWTLIIFGIDYLKKKIIKIGYVLIAAQITLAVVYFTLIGKNLGVNTDPKTWLSNPFALIYFVIVGVSNTVVGRWLWPQESLKTRAACLLVLLLVIFISKSYKWMANRNILYGIFVVVGSFVTFAIPRWRFGIGHAMANYYAYFPLPFLLISLAILLYTMKLSGLKKMIILSLFLIHIPLSWIGFESCARTWVIRPQQTKAYFQELNTVLPGTCIENRYIPEYIVPQNIWRIEFMWPIFKKNFDPFCKK